MTRMKRSVQMLLEVNLSPTRTAGRTYSFDEKLTPVNSRGVVVELVAALNVDGKVRGCVDSTCAVR